MAVLHFLIPEQPKGPPMIRWVGSKVAGPWRASWRKKTTFLKGNTIGHSDKKVAYIFLNL